MPACIPAAGGLENGAGCAHGAGGEQCATAQAQPL